MPCKCEKREEREKRELETDPIQIGIQFETRDVDQFLSAFQEATEAVQALGDEATITARALERLSRANKAARQALRAQWLPPWLYRLLYGRGET